jgi:hypothetical protein
MCGKPGFFNAYVNVPLNMQLCESMVRLGIMTHVTIMEGGEERWANATQLINVFKAQQWQANIH